MDKTEEEVLKLLGISRDDLRKLVEEQEKQDNEEDNDEKDSWFGLGRK